MSSPQKSLLVSAFTKLDFGSLTRFSENCATDTSIEVESSTVNVLLSIVRITLPSRETVEIFILVFSGTTSGRTLRLCGAIGAMMSTLASGVQIGPPALSE